MLSDEHLARRSKSQFEQMKSKEPVSSNRNDQAMIEEIGKRIAGVAQVDLPGTEWEFVVFQKNEPNAFAMPGGKVGVNSGLIELAGGNEDEIAAVMGHEIAHVAFRHSNKRMSQAMGIALGGVILNTALRDKSSTDRMIAGGAYGVGTTVGMALPFSRKQEREADHRVFSIRRWLATILGRPLVSGRKCRPEKSERCPSSYLPIRGTGLNFFRAIWTRHTLFMSRQRKQEARYQINEFNLRKSQTSTI